MAGTILLADRSAVIHKTVKQVLANEGIEVVSTGNGELAIALLDAVRPDLVMVETSLPGTNGYALCEQIKREPRFAHVSVVLLAWTSEKVDQLEALRVGVDAILSKPFEARKLVAVTRRLLNQSQEKLDAKATVIPFPIARWTAPKSPDREAATNARDDKPSPPTEIAGKREVHFTEVLAAMKESRAANSIETDDAPSLSLQAMPESHTASTLARQPDDNQKELTDQAGRGVALAPISPHDPSKPAPSRKHWRRAAIAALALGLVGVAGPVLMQSRGAREALPASSTASMNVRQNPPSLPNVAPTAESDTGQQANKSARELEAANDPAATTAEAPATTAEAPIAMAPPANAASALTPDKLITVDASDNPSVVKRSLHRPAQREISEKNLNPYARHLRGFRATRLNNEAAGKPAIKPITITIKPPALPPTHSKPMPASNSSPNALPTAAEMKATSTTATTRAVAPPSKPKAAEPQYANGFAEISKGVKSAAGKVSKGVKAIGKGLKKVFTQ
jgi:DNA-binding response OmpR family regulator